MAGGFAALLLVQAPNAAAEPSSHEPPAEKQSVDRPEEDTVEIAGDQLFEQDDVRPPVDRVVVVGRKYISGGAPETTLNGAQIDALSARDIGEVIGRALTMSGSTAAPVIIVNGERLPNADLLLDFPPDALEGVEILSREATAQYGGNLSARVVNLVLKRSFKALEGTLGASAPTVGGTLNTEGRLQRSRIDGRAFERADGRIIDQTSLRADERPNYASDHPEAGFSTLRPRSRVVAGSLVSNRPVGDWTGNVGLSATQQERRTRAVAGDDIAQVSADAQSLGVTAGLGGFVGRWSTQVELQGRFSNDSQRGLSDADNEARSLEGRVSLSNRLEGLPAGPVSVTLTGQASRSQSSIEEGPTSRGWYQAAAGSLSIPLAAPAIAGEEQAFGIGSLSLSLGGGLKRSETGGGHDANYGLAWSPMDGVRFNAGWSRSVQTPSVDQRYAPVAFGDAMTVYDFQTSESVNVLPLTGGNPELRPADREILSLAASAGPFSSWQILFGSEYQAVTESNGLGASLPFTPEVEAAFPERFVRGADGRLLQIDQRPFNQEAAEAESLTSSLSFQAPQNTIGEGAGGIDTLQVTLNHTWRFRDAVRIGRGLPTMDRLSGDSGGAPRHETALQFDAMRGPWTLNAAGRWIQEYRIRRDTGSDGSGDLLIAAFGALDLKVSYALEGQMRTSGSETDAARRGIGTRIEFGVENVFDTRPEASLADGRTAPGYGRDDQDPVGRRLKLSLTQRF